MPLYYSFRIRCLLLLGVLHYFTSLSGQNGNLLLPDIFYPRVIQDNNLVEFKEDTTIINDLIDWAGNLMGKQLYLDLDSVSYILHLVQAKSQQINYSHGEMIAYQALGWSFMYKSFLDSSQYYFRKAISIDSLAHDTAKLIRHYECLGMALSDDMKYDSACIMYKKSNELALMVRDSDSVTSTTSRLARTYMIKGDMFTSAKYTLELVRMAEIESDTGALILAYSRLSNLYASMEMKDRQLEIVRKVLKLSRGMPNKSLLFKVNNLAAGTYYSAGQYDSVIYFARLNVPDRKKSQAFPLSYRALADAYLAMNQIDSARFYYDQLLEQYDLSNSVVEPALYLNLGQCEFKSGNQHKALEYYKLAEADIYGKNIFSDQETYKVLSEYYDTIGDNRNALIYLKKFNVLEDSIRRKRDAFNTRMLSMVAESKKFEDQIFDLNRENQFQSIQATKQIKEKKIVYGGSILLLGLGLVGFVRFRKYKNLKSKQTLLNERLRISRELHDEVGATLSGIAMYSHVAKDQLKHEKHEEAENSLSYMQKSAGEMVNKLSDIVWLINPEQDTILEIIGRLGEYGKQMAGAKNMQMKLDVPSELTGLHIPLEARRNIYLICKEAINNAVKYSLGRVVELKVRMTGSRMLFSVHDDGIGFDARSTKEGNGLLSMQNRAKAIGASYQLTSLSGQGTQIEFQYDIHA